MQPKDQTLAKYYGKTVTVMGTVDGINPARLPDGSYMPRIIINNACVALKGQRSAEYIQHTVIRHPEGITPDIKIGYKVWATGVITRYKRSPGSGGDYGYGFEIYDDLLVFETGDRVTKVENVSDYKKGVKKMVDSKKTA